MDRKQLIWYRILQNKNILEQEERTCWNPFEEKNYAENEYYDVDVLKLFQMVAGETAKGYRLLSHPLTSSVRPDITPYKTVFLSKSRGSVDAESQILIEQAIAYAEKLYEIREIPIYQRWDDKAKNDFQLIDLSITERALEIAGA